MDRQFLTTSILQSKKTFFNQNSHLLHFQTPGHENSHRPTILARDLDAGRVETLISVRHYSLFLQYSIISRPIKISFFIALV